MNDSYFKRVQKQTATKLWINNVTPIEAQWAIDIGATGCTQNPSYPWKMLNHPDYKEHTVGLLDKIIARESDDDMVISELQAELVQEVAKVFLPVYEASMGRMGYVTIQENPYFIVERAYRNRGEYPNIMVKIPATVGGLEAIGEIVKNGVPFCATEVMSVDQAETVCKLYHDACMGAMHPPVGTLAHIAGIFDEQLANTVKREGIDISSDVLWQAGIAVAKKIYQIVKTHWPEIGFVSGGARGLHHFTEMVGADCAVTINWGGTADTLINNDPPVVQRFLQPAPHEVIDELCLKVEEFRKAYFKNSLKPEEYESFGAVVLFRTQFEKAWQSAREYVANRRAQLHG